VSLTSECIVAYSEVTQSNFRVAGDSPRTPRAGYSGFLLDRSIFDSAKARADSMSYRWTYSDVASILDDFINDRGGDKWAFDNFLSAQFSDPRLQAIQARINALPNEFPSERKRHYCSPEGIDVIRTYIEALRAKADHP